eukprot:271426_1
MAQPKPNKNDDNNDEASKETRKKMSAVFGGLKKFDKAILNEAETVVKHIIRVTDYTAHHDPEEVKEFYTEPFLVKKLAQRFANMLLQSKHTAFHTGAGISTAAKLPDYRGPQGVWTLRAQGLEPQHQITLEQAVPTYSHMAMVALFNNNLLHYLVSTNVDGLHRRSGVKKSQMAELHGNIYREICEECEAEYLRAFDVTKHCKDRRTGRLCNDLKCSGKLRDSIINFGEILPKTELDNATAQTSKADLCVVFGSSLSVEPACSIPQMAWTQSKGHVVIINLQHTRYDHVCEASGGFRCGAKIDEFMRLVMEHLNIKVPNFDTKEVFLTQLEDEIKNLRVDPDFGKYRYNIIKKSDKKK